MSSGSDGAPFPPRAIGQRQAAVAPALASPPPAKAPGSGVSRLVWTKGPDPADAAPPAKPKGDADRAGVKTAQGTTVAGRSDDESDDSSPKASEKSWIIQVGATDDPAKARALLDRARQQGRAMLAGAKPVTEKVRRREGTLYRARFTGFDFGLRRNRLPVAEEERLRLLRLP